MTLLHPQSGDSRHQELRNSPFWPSPLFKSQLVKDGEDFFLKKGISKNTQGFGPYQNKPFRGPHHNKKRGSYRERPYGGNSSQSSNQSFSSGRGRPNFRGSRGRFRPNNRGRGRGNPSTKASLSPPVGGRLCSFSRDWQINKCSSNVLNIITNGYVLPFLSKPNLVRFPLIVSEYKALPKDQALADCIQSKNAIERVDNVKSLGFYSRLFLVPKPHQRWRVVIDLSRLNTQRSRGMSIADRSIGRLPSHPHLPKLKEIPKVLPQVSGVSVHLPPLRAGHSPPGLYKDCKGSEANGPLQRSQTSPIPGRLADQVPVSGGSSSEHSGSGRSNPVLGVDNKSGKVRTETDSGVPIRGLRIPSRFSPCKTHSNLAQTSGFDPTTQVKTCFDCKMSDVANWVACLNGEDGPGGTPSHEALSVSSQGALEISSVAGQPPSLDRNDFCTSRLVAESCKCDERRRPSSQRPHYRTLYRRLKQRLGRSLRSKFYKGSVVRSGEKATYKHPRVEGGLTGPLKVQGPVSEQF